LGSSDGRHARLALRTRWRAVLATSLLISSTAGLRCHLRRAAWTSFFLRRRTYIGSTVTSLIYAELHLHIIAVEGGDHGRHAGNNASKTPLWLNYVACSLVVNPGDARHACIGLRSAGPSRIVGGTAAPVAFIATAAVLGTGPASRACRRAVSSY
jgi:hypothetical protein